MALISPTSPTLEPVTLVKCKAHVHMTHASEDHLIPREGLVRAALEDFERPTGLCLIEQC
jgi:uncharacterized phiE125 gp8 family phage protein